MGKKKRIEEEYREYTQKKYLFIALSLLFLVLFAFVALSLGSADVSFTEILSAILHKFFPNHFDSTWLSSTAIWDLRIPRVLIGILGGFGLAISGTMLQGILKNPLASPYTIGIASGAGFGAALGIIFGVGVFGGGLAIIGNAFLFSLVPTFVIFMLVQYREATPETMILAGIAMVYIFDAGLTLLEFFANPEAVKRIVFWVVGDLGKATGIQTLLIFFVLLLSVPYLYKEGWTLNSMLSGDETAKSLGINVERKRIKIMVLSALITATIVCFTGAIAFIGLVAPHICRIIIGSDHRFLIPASGLLGGLILLGSDTLARTVIAPIIVPVGVVTSLLGGPLFLYLVIRRRKEYW